jgi:hypothetical protein
LTNARAVANLFGSPALGQDRRRADHGQAGDRGDQFGQPQFLQNRRHPLLGVQQPAMPSSWRTVFWSTLLTLT